MANIDGISIRRKKSAPILRTRSVRPVDGHHGSENTSESRYTIGNIPYI